ncbi:MAG: CvpA family protein [Chloroflexi bacterium]|nr:CvpA family protein [Chloroflexota bacterium]
MDIIAAITGVKAVDLLVFFAFFALFILGYMQGIIRRLLGIGSIVISLLIAAQLRTPVGDFLSRNWTQYTPAYDHMIAFGSIFLAGTIGSTIALQLFFKPIPLFAKYPVVDEILGGLLGLLQGALILAAFYLITDPFFTIIGQAQRANEFPFIRQIHDGLEGSGTASIVRNQIVPAFLFFFGGLFPPDVTAAFRR